MATTSSADQVALSPRSLPFPLSRVSFVCGIRTRELCFGGEPAQSFSPRGLAELDVCFVYFHPCYISCACRSFLLAVSLLGRGRLACVLTRSQVLVVF